MACHNGRENKLLQQGKELAKTHCSGCHLFPDPELLDKESWKEGVLPAMALQFGIEVLQGNVYLHNKQSVLSSEDWQKIIHYYESLAPDSLKKSPEKTTTSNWAIFQLKKPTADSSQIASTLMTVINRSEKEIYTSSLSKPGLYTWNNNFVSRLLIDLASPAVDITFSDQSVPAASIITCMGGMRALDTTKGDIFSLIRKSKGIYTKTKIEQQLTRPIQSRPIDFNKDGLTDYIICGFGHNKGGLFILKQLADKSFEKIPVRETPGATQSVTGDFNNDGWEDIMALFAHADEGIWLFINDKKGGFESKNILRFPSVYGSSSFQLVDMNQDGKLDIVYTAGDNSDYSRILKPYHGLYIYLNQGDVNDAPVNFKKSYFYPINGCTKAIATDFDQDGDVDIATIAFFPDFKNKPYESFMYFENAQVPTKVQLDFKPNALPIHKNGRWICMDVNDYDGDGDEDIVLGNFSKGFLNQEQFKADWDIHTPFIVLENQVQK